MAGTLTPSWHQSTDGGGRYQTDAILKIAMVGDVSAGTLPVYTLTETYTVPLKNYYLYYLDVVPGTPSPTALYDIVIADALTGASMFATAVENLSATVASRHYVGDHPVSLFNGITVTTTNTTVASAEIDLYFYCMYRVY